MGGLRDPRNLPQRALGSPFKCFQLWRGVRGTLHCKPLKKKKKKLNFEKKIEKSQLVQNGSRKPGEESGVRKQGKGSRAVWLCNS